MVDTTKDIQQMLSKIEDIKKELVSKSSLQKIGDEAVKLIVKRTRLGYSVAESEGKKTKLNPLSDAYKAARKKNKPKGLTTASKSNLTNTGNMLDDLQASPDSIKEKVTIDFKKDFSAKKAGWVTEGGRPFNNISLSEKKQLLKIMRDIISKKIKKGT